MTAVAEIHIFSAALLKLPDKIFYMLSMSALFHKETGQTLTVFIHKVLIEKAQNLLAYSDYSLGEIPIPFRHLQSLLC